MSFIKSDIEEMEGIDMNIEEQYRVLEFGEFGDERGNLVVIEGIQDIPFAIKRVFYMYGSDSTVIRGQHANRETEFVLVNVSGSSKVKVDNGFETKIIELNRPRMGLYLSTMIYKMKFMNINSRPSKGMI